MKILVSVKRAIDYNVRIQIAPDGSGVVTDGVKHSANPFDEIALEQAIRWQEAGAVDEVIAVTIGSDNAREQLKTAAAFGCGRVIHVQAACELQPPAVACVLAEMADETSADLILMGKQAIDDDCSQTGPMVAQRLGWPQATFASEIELDESAAQVTRELDGGLERLEVDYPAVITADLRLCEPRYLRLPDIMRAKKHPIENRSIDEFDTSQMPELAVGKVTPPPERPAGVRVESTSELVATLGAKGLV